MSVVVRRGVVSGSFLAIAGRLPLDGPDAWLAPLRQSIEPGAMLTRKAWAADPWLAAAEAVSLYLAVMHCGTAWEATSPEAKS
ncbi:MAG: hypothetical protein ACIAQU_02335 [Phycisphaerales bacterium JB064]